MVTISNHLLHLQQQCIHSELHCLNGGRWIHHSTYIYKLSRVDMNLCNLIGQCSLSNESLECVSSVLSLEIVIKNFLLLIPFEYSLEMHPERKKSWEYTISTELCDGRDPFSIRLLSRTLAGLKGTSTHFSKAAGRCTISCQEPQWALWASLEKRACSGAWRRGPYLWPHEAS